ncbi:HD domain-containing protein [Ferdinandcohnia quinoae]|uniref:HD domain-containing protein n=1 Tax=Fredinandcohnia quinoae TaxID=2918902 RepID=A0AAW5E9L4_9BACI|nr:HD domain-containing protein [Fredinandcohnia sp. SECRCQ15]MCH1626721.1 HD domain-containing protein [Fredinandcohnia sp. SECRCQ15]
MVDKMVDSLLEKVNYLKKEQIEQLREAISFAIKAHHGQRRATGEPYIIHPFTVCEILTDYNADVVTLISALLHDVVEDTNYTIVDIIRNFGSQVALIVEGLTKVDKGTYQKEEYNAINVKKLLTASIEDVRVAIIKIADRLHNMRTLSVKKIEQKVAYANETLSFFSPLAERLGLFKMQVELEELGFGYLNPTKYQKINKLINNYQNLFIEKFRIFIDEMKVGIDTPPIELEWGKVPIYKSYSLLQEGSPFSDLFTIKVITDSSIDCYTVLGRIHTAYKPIDQQFQDNLAIEKNIFSNHLSTKVLVNDVEVRFNILTKDNLKNNQLGVFSLIHDNLTSGEIKSLSMGILKDSIEAVKLISKDPIEFYDLISYELLQKEITVFTPKLDAVLLPEGSTIIDFAFNFNPSLAKRMIHVRVNNEIKPLNTVLNDLDIVEIITVDNDTVSLVWLNYAQTAKACKEINGLIIN